MSKIIVEHDVHGKVLFDTETQQYEYYDNSNVEYFSFNGKSERYFKNTIQFLDSNVKIAVIPVVCSNIGSKGRRTYITIIDWINAYYTFYNVEMINSKWVKNNIGNLSKGKCYFIIVARHQEALNDFIILSAMQIKKGMHTAPPLP